MNDSRHRLAVIGGAIIMVIVLCRQGHDSPPREGFVAFLRYTSTAVLVRLEGDLSHPGLYQLPGGAMERDVIMLTHGGQGNKGSDSPVGRRVLRQGDVVRIKKADGEMVTITEGCMGAKERVLLGIPLELGRMSDHDWQEVPGIGRKSAEAIISYRQKNGEFDSVDDLTNVPGVGGKIVENVKKYFLNDNILK